MGESKSFWDYTPAAPPQGWIASYTGSMLMILKLFGDVQSIRWSLIVTFLVGGAVYTLIHTAIRQAKAG